jgi:hypothetical protein
VSATVLKDRFLSQVEELREATTAQLTAGMPLTWEAYRQSVGYLQGLDICVGMIQDLLSDMNGSR